MLLTKTLLVAAAIAGGLLAAPPSAAAPRPIHEPPPWPVPRLSPVECKVVRHAALCALADDERTSQKHGIRTRAKR